MKTEILYDIAYFMSLPYTIKLKKDEDGEFVGRVEELEGCIAHGATELEAIESLKRMQELWIQDCIEAGNPVPLPYEEAPLPSGKWVQRVPRSLHKKLTEKAKRDEVSLNQLVTSILAEAVGKIQASQWINEALIDRCIAGQVHGKTSHIESMWIGRQGSWQIGSSPCTPFHEVVGYLPGVINMTTPQLSTVLYHDNEKNTSDPWFSLR
jgi:antitoxin HicB